MQTLSDSPYVAGDHAAQCYGCEGCEAGREAWEIERRENEAMRGHADLDGARIMAATPEVERCYFCLNHAHLSAEIAEDEYVRVCGIHA